MSRGARPSRPGRPGRPAGQRAQQAKGARRPARAARAAQAAPQPEPQAPIEPLRLDYVEGATPSRWIRAWGERMPQPLLHERVDVERQEDRLRDGSADAALVRLPIDETGMHVVRLYDERAFVVVPAEHPFAVLEAVALGDLEGETVLARDGMTWSELVEVVASGVGVATMPQSLARLHHRRDVASLPVEGMPGTTIALAWRRDRDAEDVQALAAIVRGRSARSSR